MPAYCVNSPESEMTDKQMYLEPLVDLFDPSPSNNNGNSLPPSLPPEPGEGNVEYKLKLVSPSRSRFEHLVTQMKWRLREGQGEAIYEIGVEDNGLLTGLSEEEMAASLDTLHCMASKLGATTSILRERLIETDGEHLRKAAEVLVRKVPDDQHSIDLRIAVLGNIDTGKSTLLGVLSQGELDNGRGRARLNLFRHLHEIQSGRTSSISHEIMGFDSQGKIINYSTLHTAEEICEASTKLLTFLDLAGHQKYLKTTIFGMTGYSPHYAMLLVSATTGMAGTTKEHLGLAMALEVPIFVVVSKIDVCPPHILQRTLGQLDAILKSPGCKKVPLHVQTEDDAITAASNLTSENITPLFTISNVTGQGLELLTKFLNVLPPSMNLKERERLMQELPEFQVDETFRVPDVGCVVGGLLTKGVIKEGDELTIGPTEDGQFVISVVQSIHRNRAPCRIVRAGQSATLAIGNSDMVPMRRGIVLLSPSISPQSCLYFQAKIYVLYHTTSIYQGFQTTIYIGNIRQTVTIEGIMAKPSGIHTNENATVMFKFLKHPEFLTVGARLLFREGCTKGVGQVTQIFPLDKSIRR
uniref:GTP-binding protein 2 n=1 Tax=Scolopendra viridis TaxID=118503 RepID=A0A4D5RA46_SCOVI